MAEDLTVEDVAARLGISQQTVRRWLKAGYLKGYRIGGTKIGWRIPATEMERIKHLHEAHQG